MPPTAWAELLAVWGQKLYQVHLFRWRRTRQDRKGEKKKKKENRADKRWMYLISKYRLVLLKTSKEVIDWQTWEITSLRFMKHADSILTPALLSLILTCGALCIFERRRLYCFGALELNQVMWIMHQARLYSITAHVTPCMTEHKPTELWKASLTLPGEIRSQAPVWNTKDAFCEGRPQRGQIVAREDARVGNVSWQWGL